MVISLNGLDNSGKSTQCKNLMNKHPDIYMKKIHINDTPSFKKAKYNYDWWFDPNNGEEFASTIYTCLKERNELAKSIDKEEKIIIFDKGNDFYETRILATLIAKGYSYLRAKNLQSEIRNSFNLPDIEAIKFFLSLSSSDSVKDFESEKQALYHMYLEINRIILLNSNIDYTPIGEDSIDNVSEKINNLTLSRLKKKGEM